jgi:uncharacterized protein GlcG (DUF336 family)
MKYRPSSLLVLLILSQLLPARPATSADVANQTTLTLQGAQRVASAAALYARTHAAPGGAIAIVDAGGQTILVQRLDGTFPAGADISVGKARTAVNFGRATRGIEETINKGRTAMVPVAAVTSFTPLQGGVPIVVGGHIVGAIGVSGAASAQQDEEVAMAGAQALDSGTPPAAVAHFESAQVAAAFGQGESGQTLSAQPLFRVNASRRDGAGEAEMHGIDTDIFYVLEGDATLVTGGEIVDARSMGPNEVRGSALRDGNSVQLQRGDVVTIPNGVPHWFRSVHPPFRYFVVKAATGL